MKIVKPPPINFQSFIKILFTAFFVITISNSCENDDADTMDDDITVDDDTNQDENPSSEDPVLKDNVVVIKDDISEIISSESDLAEGIYAIEFTETPPEIVTDDIIVGSEGGGFIRRVTHIDEEGNILTISTTQASLRDVFQQGTIEFTTDPAKKVRKTQKKDQFDFSDIPSLSPYFEITSGKIIYDPEFYIKVEYGQSDEGNLTVKYDNSILVVNCNFSINSNGMVNKPEFATTLDSYQDTYIQEIAGMELVYETDIEIIALFGLRTDDVFGSSAGVTNDMTLSFNTDKIEDIWNGNINLISNHASGGAVIEQPANVVQSLTFVARVNAKIQGVIGAYFQAEMNENFVVNYDEPTKDWDSELHAGTDFTYGIDDGIFGFAKGFSQNKNFRNKVWHGPVNIKIESGDDQIGFYYGENQTQSLSEPLKVLITDSQGPLKNVNVHYKVLNGGGLLEQSDVLTDVTGFAENNWTLGNEDEEQAVEVTINKANGDLIGDSPVEFNATMIDLSGTWIIESTTTNCPETSHYSFKFNPNNNSLIILGNAPEIVSTEYDITIPDLVLSIGITSKENFEYICEVDNNSYITEETGVLSLIGTYLDQEFRGEFGASFTELPVNPCVNNVSCQGNFIIHR